MRSINNSVGGSANIQRALTWVIFLGGASAIAYWCLAILRSFADVIAWSAILAIICYPVHERLVRKTRRVALSAFITSTLMVFASVVPVLLLAGVAVNEFVALGHPLQRAFNDHREYLSRLTAPAAWLTTRLGLDDAAIAEWSEGHFSDLAHGLAQSVGSIATGVVDAAVSSVLVVFALFLLLRDGERIVASITGLLPFERRRGEALLRRIKDVVQVSVYGVVVIAVLQGVLCGAMLWLLGVPAAALWGMVTMFASLLPVVGAFAVWGPATVYLAVSGDWSRAMVLAIWGTFVISGIDNIVRPRLVAGRVGLSELAMLFAMLGGLSVFGGLGIVLGPVVFATAAAIIDTLRAPQTNSSAAVPSIAAASERGSAISQSVFLGEAGIRTVGRALKAPTTV
jgi:predicted PurR-regulated permease PerM